MKLSVIIPIQNRASLIGETLDSIFRQTRQPDEIILVDDHSTDHLDEALEKYGSRIIRLTNKGTGPGAGRNTGMEAATGELIQFFDSDDVMSVNKLAVQAALLEADRNADVVYGPYLPARRENNKWIPTDDLIQYFPLPHRPLHHLVAEGWCAVFQSAMFTRRILEAAGPWREDLITHEDKEYWYRIGRLVPFPLHENQSLTVYRQHEKQITGKELSDISRTLNALVVFKEVYTRRFTDQLPLKSGIILKGLIVHYEKYANRYGYTFPVSVNDQIVHLLSRIHSKAGRMRSGNNWHPMHGVSKVVSGIEDI